jgi:hypothetical protein
VVERLWRSVKYEEVYLRAYGSVSDARVSIGRYLTFYTDAHILPLTARCPIRPTSTNRFAQRHEPGRHST